ncbi:hypothetical protein RPIT_12465 [Tessaracoccus flavus]|uniref:Uncharacterized protein n=1 Tax=Tessaracoccus flavus TaxID=1610493 RepID=A0A1Q2CHC8_9ACTN|nr:hypothetical protein RPIT_12465 [Tessaracoccus flavus]
MDTDRLQRPPIRDVFPVAAMTVARLLAALDSQVTLTLDDGDDFDRHIDARAGKDLDRLARVGLYTGDTDQGFVAPLGSQRPNHVIAPSDWRYSHMAGRLVICDLRLRSGA